MRDHSPIVATMPSLPQLIATAATVCMCALVGAGVSAAAQPTIPGEIIVEYRPTSGTAARASARRAAGTRAARTLSGRLELVRTRVGDEDAALSELRSDPRVARATRNRVMHAQASPNDTYYPLLWGLHNTGQVVNGTTGAVDADIDAPEAWEVRTTGAAVAIVDSGVDATHPDLSSALWVNSGEIPGDGIDNDGNGFIDDTHGWDWIQGDNDPTHDGYGHGTHVAGTVAGAGNNAQGVTGVAWDAPIIPLRVLDDSGNGSFAHLLAAFNYAGAAGIPIVNASLGGEGDAALQLMIADVVDDWPDTFYVVAAGNDTINFTSHTASLFLPCEAALVAPNMICVAASDARDERAAFSNHGQAATIAAPGVNIFSAYPADLLDPGSPPYTYLSGTSMASPHVAGVASLVHAESGVGGAALRTRLEDTAEQVFTLEEVPNHRRLNAHYAVRGTRVDITAPTAPTITSPSAGVTNDARPTLTWTAGTDTDGMFAHRVLVDGIAVATLAPDVTTYALSGTLIEGERTLSVVAVDRAGNASSDSVVIDLDRTPPSTPTIALSAGELNRWQDVESVRVSASATDVRSGVSAYHYRIDSGEWDTTGAEPSVGEEGETRVCARAVDHAGNMSGSGCGFVRLDRSAPSAPTEMPFSSGEPGVWQSVTHVTITAAGSGDTHSGIARYEFQGEGEEAWTADSYLVTGEGERQVCARSVDRAGLVSDPLCVAVLIDRTAPSATWTIEPEESVVRGGTLAYTATFDEPVSGLSSVDVRIDGTAPGCIPTLTTPTNTTVAVEVTGCRSGDVSIALSADSAVDRAGNTGPGEDLVASTVAITEEFPVLSWSAPTRPTRAESVVFTLGAPVGISGLAAESITALGSAPGCALAAEQRDAMHIDVIATGCGEGTLALDIAADSLVDHLGHSGPAATERSPLVLIDRTPPGTPVLTVMGGAQWQSVSQVDVRAEGSATDTDPTPAYYARVGEGEWDEMAPDVDGGRVSVSAEGSSEVCVRSVDTAGNTSAPECATVQIDRTPPTVAVLVGPGDGASVTPGAVDLAWAPGDDALSGLAAQRVIIGSQVIALGPEATSARVNLTAGTWSWQIEGVDTAGNVRASAARTLVVAERESSPPSAPADPAPPNEPADPCAGLTGSARVQCAATLTAQRVADAAAATLAARLSACASRPPAGRTDCRSLARADYAFTMTQARATRNRDVTLARCAGAARCARIARATYTRSVSIARAARTRARALTRCDGERLCVARARARYAEQVGEARRAFAQAVARQ